MKALSIHQPWAWAILSPTAGKNIENRTWHTSHRGPMLVHASKSRASYDRQDADEWRDGYGVRLPAWDALVKGAILGVVDVVDCVRAGPSLFAEENVWAEGPWCWMLENPRAFAEPIPYRGAQLLFDVPDELLPAGIR